MTEQEMQQKIDKFFNNETVIKVRDKIMKGYVMYLNIRHPSIKHGYSNHSLLGPMIVKIPRK
jgi:hypothetical protein